MYWTVTRRLHDTVADRFRVPPFLSGEGLERFQNIRPVSVPPSPRGKGVRGIGQAHVPSGRSSTTYASSDYTLAIANTSGHWPSPRSDSPPTVRGDWLA